MFASEFMRLALAAGAIVGVLAPAVGFFLVQRRQSLVGDGIGHVAFAGVAVGILLDVSPVLTALVAAVLGGVAIEVLRSRGRAAGDQALAIVFYTGTPSAVAGGVARSSRAGLEHADRAPAAARAATPAIRRDGKLVIPPPYVIPQGGMAVRRCADPKVHTCSRERHS